MKRIFDITLVSSTLPIWLMLIGIALPVAAISTRTNGIFVQRRMGLNGEEFPAFKLRTMKQAKDLRTSTITRNDDPRIPLVAKWLRSLKIDELPQLINVLRGEMSLVGPRPLVSDELHAFPPGWEFLLRKKPGLTGVASLRWRNESKILTSFANSDELYFQAVAPDKVKLERWYVQHGSIWLDALILIWTIFPWMAPRNLRPITISEFHSRFS